MVWILQRVVAHATVHTNGVELQWDAGSVSGIEHLVEVPFVTAHILSTHAM